MQTDRALVINWTANAVKMDLALCRHFKVFGSMGYHKVGLVGSAARSNQYRHFGGSYLKEASKDLERAQR